MTNYFYFDGNGTKQGPVNDQQLMALASQGVITPDTPLETEGGHKGVAGQIPGLNFPFPTGQIPHPKASRPAFKQQTVPKGEPTYVTQMRFRSDTDETPIFPLLYDFTFRELKPESIYLWIVKMAYAAGLFVIALAVIAYSGFAIYTAFALAGDSRGMSLFMLLAVPLLIIGGFLSVCMLRLFCDWGIITFHCAIEWLVELTKLPKALRSYLEEKSKGE